MRFIVLLPLAAACTVSLAACGRPTEYQRERAAFDYAHPPLGSGDRATAHAVVDSVARAVRGGDRERLDSLITEPRGRAWALDHRGMFATFDSARLSNGYWLRRRADTAWVHYDVPYNSCTRRVTRTTQNDRPVFVLVRLGRSWRVVDGWLTRC